MTTIQYDGREYRILAPGELERILERHRKWAVGEAEGDRASLDGASLIGARLVEASLIGASLGGWTIFNVGPIGSRNATLTYKRKDGFEEIMTGCFRGTLAQFEEAVTRTHGDNAHAQAYRRAVAFIREMCPDTTGEEE